MVNLRTLAPGDEAALEAFLVQHADSSMFLRSNVRAAGLADLGRPYEATYVAAFEQDRIAAYVSLGFTPVGDYGLFLLAGA
ncbi:hypothetical protein WMF30_09585 [Sorangium sp. So ce134]